MKLLGGGAILALALMTSPARAADYAEPGCILSGAVTAGFMFDWQEQDFDGDGSLDVDWTTPFGEGAGLVTCGTLNIQADLAYYAHSGEFEFDEEDTDQTNSHIGGALFYRDPSSWAGGAQASWISQSLFGGDMDVFRAGLFGEFYLDDSFTLGAAAAVYFSDNLFGSLDDDGVELALYGRYYPTPDLGFELRGDLLFADVEINNDGDIDGFALAAAAEYLVWDQGLSLFAGARYAERTADFDGGGEFDTDDMQVFGGIKFHLGQGGTLVERHRTGPVDNTSVFKEKLPSILLDPRS
ncbi:MAG: hypothetical protein AB7F09_26710 [Parvibaculaceae bacterium]